jgi:WD40 repeat protein
MKQMSTFVFIAFFLAGCAASAPPATATPSPPPTPNLPTSTATPVSPGERPWEFTLTTEDGLQLAATLFGEGEVAVILAHQGTIGADQTTWHAFAQILAEHGFTALTIDFRGNGESEGFASPEDLDLDLMAGIQFLKDQGFTEIICVGASKGGTACTRVALDSGEFSAIAVIASGLIAGGGSNSLMIEIDELPNLTIPKLFLTAAQDSPSVVSGIQRMYDHSPEPKEIHFLPGREHGTDLFQTEAGDDLSAILLRFVLNPGGSSYQAADVITELTGTVGPVYSLAWSPDGRWLATAGYRQVRIWDVATMEEYISLEEPTSFVWGLSWSPDGRFLACACKDGTIRVWESEDFEIVGEFESGWAFSIAWSPESSHLAVGTQAGPTQIWSLDTGEILMEIEGSSPVISLAWHPQDDILTRGLLNGEIRLWNPTSSALEITLLPDSQTRADANGLAWSADGRLLASAHQDLSVRIWDLSTGEQTSASLLSGHQGWVRAIAWSPGDQCLVSGGEDSRLRIWDPVGGEMLTSLIHGTQPIWAAAWSPDGRYLAVADGTYQSNTAESTIWIWEITGCGTPQADQD